MNPERESSLVEILDRLLNKGAILNADLIISVAGIPLIGLNLRAALASMETMLEYGIMEDWDKSSRELYARAGDASASFSGRADPLQGFRIYPAGAGPDQMLGARHLEYHQPKTYSLDKNPRRGHL